MRTAAPAARVPCRVRPWLLAGRQGALPGAPLTSGAVRQRALPAPTLAARVPCQVRPWLPPDPQQRAGRPTNAAALGALLGVPLAFVAIGTVLRTCGNRRAAQLEEYQGALPGTSLVSDKACACTCDHVRVCACKC